MWSKLWKTPQAIVWEEQGVERAVARYVRLSIVVESGDVPAAKVKSVMEQERTLLLELGSLLKAGYRISSGGALTPTAAPKAEAAKPRSNVVDIRGRWKGSVDEDEQPDF